MAPCPQGFHLNEPIRRLLTLIASGDLCHGDDPILSWMADNTVTLPEHGGQKRVRLAKDRAPEKIDGIAALVMGIDGAVVRRERTQTQVPQLFFVGGR